MEKNPKFKIFKIENSIYFATAESFKSNIIKRYEKTLELKVIEEDLNNSNSSTVSNENRKNSGSISISIENSTDEYFNLSKLPDIILDFSAVNYIDTNGIKAVQQLIEYYIAKDVHVYICNSQGRSILLIHFILYT